LHAGVETNHEEDGDHAKHASGGARTWVQ
jgi:hypothetical protein